MNMKKNKIVNSSTKEPNFRLLRVELVVQYELEQLPILINSKSPTFLVSELFTFKSLLNLNWLNELIISFSKFF